MSVVEKSETKSRCLYCGNNPTNHRATYINESLLVLGMPVWRSMDFLMRPFVYQALHNTLLSWWMKSLELVGFISYSTDITKARSDRSRVVWEEADRRGIKMEQMIIEGKPCEQYRAHMHGRWHYFCSVPIPPTADRRAYVWMDSKVGLKKFFTKHGVRVPKGGPAWTLAHAEQIFNSVEKPVIVKPEIGSRGRHTSTNLSTIEDVRKAFKIAKQLCCRVVVEEHLVGSVYRGTYVGGEIVGNLRGDPPRITGDGILSVGELIGKKNREKPERVKDVVVTDVILAFIARQGYTLDSVLPKGKTIDILEKIGLSYGGDAVEDFLITHPRLLEALKKAGDVLGAPIVGFDFISEDITKDPDTVRWGIIEANPMPFIDLHHFPRMGPSINVAAKVWDLWEKDEPK